MRMKTLTFLSIVLGFGSIATAAEAPGGIPAMPDHPVWPGVMLFIVGGMFLAAATVGPLVAILMPTAVEPESHDEHELDEPDNHAHHH
jgi:hypothetical protein